MGRKLDALLGRGFKTAKFKALVNLAVSRIAVLRHQRQARYSVASSDVVKLLEIGHHERALLRVNQVIKEQNMLDVLDMTEGYLTLLSDRIHLIEQERECPEELKEAVSSLLFAASRCGDFPELPEIRAVLTSRFGREFAARAVELRNNCGVNHKMVQKLSTKMPGLENRMEVLKEIASESNIVLRLDEPSPGDQILPDEAPSANSGSSKVGEYRDLPEEIEKIDVLSDSMKTRKKYKDVVDAAQAAFESAAYAAEAARAAVELSRAGSGPPDDQDSPDTKPRRASQRDIIESGNQEVDTENITEVGKHTKSARLSTSSVNSDSEDMTLDEVSETQHLQKDAVFDDSDIEARIGDKNLSEKSASGFHTTLKLGTVQPTVNAAEESEMPSPVIDFEKKPISVRNKRIWGY